jgi:hypothetical protein
MTYRAIVQDGLIVFNTKGAIPDGTSVEITVSKERGATSRARTKLKTKPGSRPRTAAGTRVPGFGMWADRKDLGPADSAVDRLRASTRRRRVG